eukprot:TRINITY_DN10240_c0_g1_i1.p1 TRINITY_DN10240_c0_g1~~TRINITY_DN10240_c0_g1_i1.p1  ORF type:complete len:585 (+),score=121.02 TRINITY_DN10240_c0_g1_i1:104-1858(+)
MAEIDNVTLASLRAELQDFAQSTMRSELQASHDKLLGEMQKMMMGSQPCMPVGEQSCWGIDEDRQHHVVAIRSRNSSLERRGDAQEAAARPPAVLEPVAAHGTMESSERLLQIQPGAERSEKTKRHRDWQHHEKDGKVNYNLEHKAISEMTSFEQFRKQLNDLIASDGFDMLSGLMVLANATYIGYQTDWVARHWSNQTPGWFHIGDLIFCMTTVVEVGIRIMALGPGFFHNDGYGWNWFDFLVGSTQVLDLGMSFIAGEQDGGHQKSSMSGARILKLVRIFRIARIASVFPQLHVLISSIIDSLSSLFWTLVLIFAFLYAVAIALTQVVNEHKMAKGLEHMEQNEETVLELYGNLQASMISLYMIISEGIHWGELCDPLAENISPMMRIVFVVFVGFMLFAMMNIITACFVDNAMRIAAKAEVDTCLTKLWQMMEASVEPGECVTMETFIGHWKHPGMEKFLELTDSNGENPVQIFGLIDESGDGKLDADEFVEMCSRLMGNAKAMQVKKDIFALRDETLAQFTKLEEYHQGIVLKFDEVKALQKGVSTSHEAIFEGMREMEARIQEKIEKNAAAVAAGAEAA